MAIAVGAHDSAIGAAGTTIATAAVTTQAAGSTFVIGFLYDTGAGSVTPSDSKGNSYTLLGSEAQIDATGRIRWYYCENGTGGASHTATLTSDNAGTARAIFFAEITGGATSGILGSGAAAPAQGQDAASPFTSSNVTPATGNVLLLSFIGGDTGDNPATTAAGNSFSIVDQETNGSTSWAGALASRAVTGDGSTSYQSSFTQSGATQAAVAIAVFKETAGASSTTVNPAQATLTVSGRTPSTSTFQNVRIRDVLVNGTGQAVGNATDLTLLVWYSGRLGGAPDVSLNGMTTDANGSTSWSIPTGPLGLNEPIAWTVQNAVSLSNYSIARMIPSYE